MAETGIRLEGIWKKFRRGNLHDSLRDLIPALAKRMVRRGKSGDDLLEGDFWAVHDVSFTVRQGETLGIIGGNGAGKSTILKVLTNILRPTRGVYHVEGRIGALIEIAAGFHPDLTGRENVFLQGAIRGMPSELIRTQFDAIVDFSGISDFIDTPVKRYSSGMNARLGFAIAAHLDPEVLIIDEVLAVGDFGFQMKAFSRIREMATSGIPVVIVSHQLDRITELCSKVILLDHGTAICEGTAAECIVRYTENVGKRTSGEPTGPIRIASLTADTDRSVRSGAEIEARMTGSIAPGATAADGDSLQVRVVPAQTGTVVFETTTGRLGLTLPSSGEFSLKLTLQMNLPPGVYRIESYVYSEARAQVVSQGPAVNVQVSEGARFHGSVQLNPRLDFRTGTA